MASRPAWLKAGAVLRMTYGKLATRDALNALYRKLDDLSDARLLETIERHLDDTTEESGGSLAGSWFPKPAQLRFHANAIHVEELRARRLELEAQAEALKAASEQKAQARVVEFPAAATAAGLQGEVQIAPSDCKTCRDSGMATYYIPADRSHPANKYRVFLEAEYWELPEDMQRRFKAHSAVCDCAAGKLRRDSNPGGHVPRRMVNGRWGRVYITIEEAARMAAKRQEKDLARYGGEAAER